MPDFKKPDPEFPKREGGSLLKAGIAATPLTVGVAASLRGIAIDGTLKQPQEAGIDQAMRHLASRSRTPPIPSLADVNSMMNRQSGDLARQAWKWATSTVDPLTKRRLLSYTQGIEEMADTEVRSAIAQSVTQNESIAMSKIWRRYQNISGMLETQVSMTGILPKYVSVEDLTAFTQQRIVPLSTPMPESMLQRINRIATTMSATASPYGITRPEVSAEGYGMWNVMFKGGPVSDIKVSLPKIVRGTLLEGAELQTRRIAPDVVHISKLGEVTRMDRTGFFLKELEESVIPDIGGRLKTERDIEQAVRQLKERVFGELEAVPNVLPEGMTAAQAQREALRGMAVDIVVEEEKRQGRMKYRAGFRRPTDTEITKLMASSKGRELGLRGGVGPKGLAKGRLSTAEWERFYLGPIDYGRRPEQKIREFQATEETMEMLGQRKTGQRFRAAQMLSERTAYENVARPQVKIAYVDPERHAKFLEQIAMGEGEAVARAQVLGRMRFEESKTMKLMQAREDIENFRALREGEVLGTTAAGEVKTLPRGAQVTNIRRLTDQMVQVEYMQQHKFRHGDKMFDAAKAVVLMRKNQEFKAALSELQLPNTAADLIVSMDELRKNRSLHKSQIISALDDLVTGTWSAQRMGRQWAQTSASHEGFIRQAMKASIEELEITPREFGRVFGAVPTVLEKEELTRVTQGLAPEFQEEMLRGVAAGRGGIAYGGPRLEAGVMGSIEPRAFDILRGGAMGDAGQDVAAELAQRLAVTNPETVIAHQQLAKSLASMTGEQVTPSTRVWKPGMDFQKFIETGGGTLRPGQGLPDIYVPGADVMQAMQPFETPTGVQVRGKVSDIYHDLASATAQLREKRITAKEFEVEMETAAGMIRKEFAPAGKGVGAITRGKVIGTRFLRGVSAMEAGAKTAIQKPDVVGITQSQFEKMYNELVNSKLYGDDLKALEGMKNRFLADQNVAGMLTRHPFIGEFSMQPTYFKKVEGAEDLIVLPEIKQNIRVRAALEGEFKEKTLTLGPLVGMAGDKDADAYSAILLGPRNEERLRKELLQQNSEFAQRHAQHQIRMQLFKAGKAGKGAEEATLKQMFTQVEKLSVGQKWIAPLSLEMTTAKQALTKFGSGQAAADARFLLEWLEQTPISAKHLKAEQAAGGGLESLMMSITDAMAARDVTTLQNNIQTIVKNDAVASKMLTGNVFIDKPSAEALTHKLGTQISTDLSGVNIISALKELMRTLGEADATGYTRQAQLMAGRGSRVKMSEIAELAAKGTFKATTEAGGVMAQVSRATGAASNLLGQVGRGLIRHHKAIGFGFAGSIALAAALSDPPKMVGSGSGKIPDPKIYMNRTKAAGRMKSEDLHPPQDKIGQPKDPQLMRNQNVRVATTQPRKTNVRVTAQAGPDVDTRRLASTVAASTGGVTGVNLIDNRSKLHAYDIAGKLL